MKVFIYDKRYIMKVFIYVTINYMHMKTCTMYIYIYIASRQWLYIEITYNIEKIISIYSDIYYAIDG